MFLVIDYNKELKKYNLSKDRKFCKKIVKKNHHIWNNFYFQHEATASESSKIIKE